MPAVIFFAFLDLEQIEVKKDIPGQLFMKNTINKKDFYFIPGFHGVQETLRRKKVRVKELWIMEGKKSVRTEKILCLARELNIPVRLKKGSELADILPGITHQGIIALAEKFHYADLDNLLRISLQKQDQGILIAADHITDEGNLGSLIRTAAFFGAHGLLIPKDRSAGISTNVLKRSSGAHAHLPITRVVNMSRTLNILKKKGFWIIGAAGEGSESIYRFDWKRDLVLVLGNEQRGLSRAVRELCHEVVNIPSWGKIEALNVGVAGGIILSEIVRQRSSGS